MSFKDRINYIAETYEANSGRRLSRKTGIPYTTIREYRTGIKTNPRLSMLNKLIETYNISALWLLTGQGNIQLTDTAILNEKAQRIAELKDQINELKEDKKHLKSLLNARFNASDIH